MTTAFLLYVCSFHHATVLARDMYGRDVKYQAAYWTCKGGARPSDSRSIPLCYTGDNPYNPMVWTLPWYKGDVEWLCAKD